MTARTFLAAPAAGMSTAPLHLEPTGSVPAPLQGCYFLCLDRPYFHAHHYVVI